MLRAHVDDDDGDLVHSQAPTQPQPSTASWLDDDDVEHASSNDDDDSVDDPPMQPFSPPPVSSRPASPVLPAAEGQEDGRVGEGGPRGDDPPAAEVSAASSAAVKRPQSSFLLFCADHRAAVRGRLSESGGAGGVAAVAKVLGEMWKTRTAEQKSEYEAKAKEAKAAYQRAVLQRQASPAPARMAAPSPFEAAELTIPPSFVKRLLHLDPSIKRTSKEAACALSCCAEAFLSSLVTACTKVAAGRKRRRLAMDDVLAVVDGVTGMDFLRAEMRTMKKEFDAQRDRERQVHEAEKAAQRAADASADPGKENACGPPHAEGDAAAAADSAVQCETQGKVGKSKKKAIDPTAYQSLTAMFSRGMERATERRAFSERDQRADDADVEEIVMDLDAAAPGMVDAAESSGSSDDDIEDEADAGDNVAGNAPLREGPTRGRRRLLAVDDEAVESK